MGISVPLSGLGPDDDLVQDAEGQGVLDADAVFVQLVCQTGPGEHDPNGTPDDRVRPSHAALHGTVWRLDDPRAPIPPMDFGCFLPDAPISGIFDGASRAFYNGDAVEIRTKSGARIRVTANHPTLTGNGLSPAGLIHNGDKVLVDPRQVIGRALTEVDEDHRPPTAEQVFHAFLNAGPMLSATNSAHYFHGDGKAIDGKIDVVGAYLLLGDNLKPEADEVVADPHLIASHSLGFGPLPGPGEIHRLGRPETDHRHFSGSMSGGDLGGPLLGSHPAPLDDLLLGLGSKRTPKPGDGSGNGGAADPGPVGYGIDGLAAVVSVKDFIVPNGTPGLNACRFASGPHFNACLYKPDVYGPSANPVFSREVINESAGAVFFDDVVEVVRFKFRGHVYDFRSPFGHIITDGAFTSNCRCTLVHVAATGKPGALARKILPTAPAAPETTPALPFREWLDGNAKGWEQVAKVMERGSPAEATARGFLKARELGIPEARDVVRMISQTMAAPPGALSAREIAAIAARVNAGAVSLASLPPATRGQVEGYLAGQA